MAKPRVTTVGPPRLGLTDFPESARPEHATQAYNAEFRHGGCSTRRGTWRAANNFYRDSGGTARACTTKLVSQIRGATFGQLVVVGLVPTAGAEANEERLIVAWMSDGTFAVRPTFSVQLRPPNVIVNADPKSRWDSCSFHQLHLPDPDLIVTDRPDLWGNVPGRVYISVWGVPTARPIVGINRIANPYHGVVVNPDKYQDDPVVRESDWTTAEIAGRYCRPHSFRLVLGNVGWGMKANIPSSAASMLWISNRGDAYGWPITNIVPAYDRDMSPITGLASWNGNVVVFRRGTIGLFRLDNSNIELPYYAHSTAERGSEAHSTFIEDIEGQVVFLAHDGVYAFNGSAALEYLSRPIERTLRAMQAQFPAAHAVHHKANRQIWFAIPTQTGTPDRVFVMDYNYKPPAWSIYEYQTTTWAAAGGRKRLGGFATSFDGISLVGVSQRAIGTIDYDLFDIGDATDDQNVASLTGFRSIWESGPIGYHSNEVDRWRYVRPTLRPTGNFNLTAWWRRDAQGFDEDGNLNGQSVSLAAGASGGGALGSFVLGTDRLSANEDNSTRLDVFTGGVGRTGRFGIETSGTVGHKFDIRGFEVDVLDKGVRR